MVAFYWPAVDALAQGLADVCQKSKQHLRHTVSLTPAFLASFTTTGGNHLSRLGSKPPPESVLFSRTWAWDLVSLTKPFSQFVVVQMNIHALLLGSECPHKKTQWLSLFLFFFYLCYSIVSWAMFRLAVRQFAFKGLVILPLHYNGSLIECEQTYHLPWQRSTKWCF